MQVASTKPTMKAVAKTGGMSRKSPNAGETSGTVSPGVTAIVWLCRRPTGGRTSVILRLANAVQPGFGFERICAIARKRRRAIDVLKQPKRFFTRGRDNRDMPDVRDDPTDPAMDAQLSAWRTANNLPAATPAWHGPVLFVLKGIILVCLILALPWFGLFALMAFPFAGYVGVIPALAVLATAVFVAASMIWSIFRAIFRR
jgi:hypothetical protein